MNIQRGPSPPQPGAAHDRRRAACPQVVATACKRIGLRAGGAVAPPGVSPRGGRLSGNGFLGFFKVTGGLILGAVGGLGGSDPRRGAPHVGSPLSSGRCGSHHCGRNCRPGRRVGVRVRLAVRQASATAGVCRQRQKVRSAVPAASARRVCGDQREPAAGRAGGREAGRRQHCCGHRGFRRIDRGVVRDRATSPVRRDGNFTVRQASVTAGVCSRSQ